MTQTLPAPADLGLSYGETCDALWLALLQAGDIPTTGGDMLTIAGQPTAVYGGLIRFTVDRTEHDRTGRPGHAHTVLHVLPGDARTVHMRLRVTGRTIRSIEAVRAPLGGTTRR